MIDEEKVQDVYNLVGAFCKAYNCYTLDKVQDMTWDVWQKLVNNYDESKSKLSTYVFIICRNIYLMELRKNKSRKNILDTLSLDENIDENVCRADVIKSDYKNALEESIYDEEINEIHTIYNNCSSLLKDYLNGFTQQELSNKYFISQAQISRRIASELDKIRKKVKNETI